MVSRCVMCCAQGIARCAPLAAHGLLHAARSAQHAARTHVGEQAHTLASALVCVHRVNGHWYADSQRDLAHTLFLKLLDVDIDFVNHPPLSAFEVGQCLLGQNERRVLIELLIA